MDNIKQFRKTLLSKVTRMEALEEKLGIQIGHLSVVADPNGNEIAFNFEVTSLTGTSLKNDMLIKFVLYDEDDCIIKIDENCISKKYFIGFDVKTTGQIYLNTKVSNISRILMFVSPY